MPIYRPSELRAFLQEMGIEAKKSLSQNFLIDGNICRNIVKAADITPGDSVLEIGPGPGVVTEELLNAGAKVIAVEKDAALAKALERLNHPNLTIFCDDILTFPFKEHLKEKTKVVSNLPYHITTPIITALLPERDYFSTFVMMMQEEVARRFIGKPGTAAFGSITLFLEFYADVKFAFKVSPHCFYPEPKVSSAVILLHTKEPPDIEAELFFKMTRSAFAERRKMLRKTLGDLYGKEKVVSALQDLHLKEEIRGEELSLPLFIALFKRITA